MRARTSDRTRVTIAVSPKFRRQVERFMRDRGMTQSEFWREGARRLMWELRWERLRTLGARAAQQLGVKTEEDVVQLVRESRQKGSNK